MRALLRETDSFRLDARHPEPQPAPQGWAVIRPTRIGIGRRDFSHPSPQSPLPSVVGHEFVGVVESISGEDPRRLTGRRVVGQPDVACLACDLCKSGLATHCRERRTLGIRDLPGCGAELFTLPAANLVLVPDSLDDDQAVLAQPLAAALHVARLAQSERGAFITILGDGVLALLIAQALHSAAAAVRVVGWSEARLERCARWGVKHRPAREPVARADQSVVIETSGRAEARELALQFLRPRGRLLMPLLDDSAASLLDTRLVAEKELDVRGTRGGSIAESIALLPTRSIDVVSLIERRFPLSDGTAACAAAAQPDALKVLLTP